MYVIKSRKAAFIHIPKTGGRSITWRILWPLECEKIGGKPRHSGYLPGVVPEEWFIFAMHRNPYTRMASLYHHRIAISEPFKLRYPRLSDYLRFLLADNEKYPKPLTQVEHIAPCVRTYPYEQFDDSVAKICERLKVDVPDMPRKDQHANYFGKYDWRELIDVEAVRIINHRFDEDFKRFGYRKLRYEDIQNDAA